MSSSKRRQMMQPWPLCVMPFAKSKDHAILPNYKRVHTLAPNSNLELDCASNTTLLTSVSSFNSQVDLIEERKKNLSTNENQKSTTKNYYAENLKINHQNPITRAQIYDPLGKGSDTNYKQLDPLLKDSQSHDHKDIMELENAKDKVSFQFGRGSSKKISFTSKYATQVKPDKEYWSLLNDIKVHNVYQREKLFS